MVVQCLSIGVGLVSGCKLSLPRRRTAPNIRIHAAGAIRALARGGGA